MRKDRAKRWSGRQAAILSAMGLPLWCERQSQSQIQAQIQAQAQAQAQAPAPAQAQSISCYRAASVSCASGKSVLVVASGLDSLDYQNLFVNFLRAIGQNEPLEIQSESALQPCLEKADGMIVFGDCFAAKLQLNKQQVYANKPCLAFDSIEFMFENPDYKRQCWQLTKVLLQSV